MSTTLDSLCKNLLWINQMVEDVALNVDTNKTQNLELLLDAADFAKFLTMEDFMHYELHKAVGRKDCIRTSDGEGVIILILIPGGTTI